MCQSSQITAGVRACEWLAAECAGSAVMVPFETSVFEVKTCDPLFSPRRSQGPITKGFIKATESPVENTPLLPTWMELTSSALATGCPP